MLSMLQTKKLCGGPQDVCYLNIFKKLEVGSADGARVYTQWWSKKALDINDILNILHVKSSYM